MTARDTPAMRRAVRDCLAQRGRWPIPDSFRYRYMGEVSAVLFRSGHRFEIGTPYNRGAEYCEHGRIIVPHSFWLYCGRNVVIWACWPMARDERGRRTWDWLIGDSLERCQLNPL